MTKIQKQQRKTIKELDLLVNIKGNKNTKRNERYTHTQTRAPKSEKHII